MNNQGLRLRTSRRSIADYEQQTRPTTTSVFSRTYRKIQLLRKLEERSIVPKQPILRLFCKAVSTPLHQSQKDKNSEKCFIKKGSACMSTQTDQPESPDNLRQRSQPNTKFLLSFRNLPETQQSARPRVLSVRLLQKKKHQTLPSFDQKVQPFPFEYQEQDFDLMEYIKARASRKISQY